MICRNRQASALPECVQPINSSILDLKTLLCVILQGAGMQVAGNAVPRAFQTHVVARIDLLDGGQVFVDGLGQV